MYCSKSSTEVSVHCGDFPACSAKFIAKHAFLIKKLRESASRLVLVGGVGK